MMDTDIKRGGKAGIVCCSNGLKESMRPQTERLAGLLEGMGLRPVMSPFMYERDTVFSGSAMERAGALLQFYKDREIKAVFDVSGGDTANEILPYLDFNVIAGNPKPFWGYSDLTVILNAVYAKTGQACVLYQIRNLVGELGAEQARRFESSVFGNSGELFDISCDIVRGGPAEGTAVGGNVRCLLKLAGTPYWPDMKDKILLLEANSGSKAQICTYLSQLRQMGALRDVQGVLLGTFTQLEKEGGYHYVQQLAEEYTERGVTIARTKEVGHGADSKAVIIGQTIRLR